MIPFINVLSVTLEPWMTYSYHLPYVSKDPISVQHLCFHLKDANLKF